MFPAHAPFETSGNATPISGLAAMPLAPAPESSVATEEKPPEPAAEKKAETPAKRSGLIPQSRCRLYDTFAQIRLDRPGVVGLWTAARKCPVCGKTGVWRMGQEFDHEMRCTDCPSTVWQPEKEYLRVVFDTAEN